MDSVMDPLMASVMEPVTAPVMAHLRLWAAQPDIALSLLTLGVLLLFVEANRPGRVVPGCVGLLLLSLSLWSGRALPHAHLALLCFCTALLLAAGAWMLRIAFAARRNKFLLGRAGLLHKRGRAVTALTPEGRIEIAGELWPAQGAQPIAAGRPVVVAAVTGATLQVRELAR